MRQESDVGLYVCSDSPISCRKDVTSLMGMIRMITGLTEVIGILSNGWLEKSGDGRNRQESKSRGFHHRT